MQDPGSLSNLRDIVEPAPVPWWPPAPGWWIVMALIAAALIFVTYQAWRHWMANAYRRLAVSELRRANDDTEIVEILKRTAMCFQPRSQVSSLSGTQWCQWLEQWGGIEIPDQVAKLIAVGIYRNGSQRTPELAEFAERWILSHSSPTPESRTVS